MAEADDLEALVIPSSVKLAGGMLMGAGACMGIVGLQALALRTTGLFSLVGPIALMLSGGCVFAGWGVVRGRARAALFGLGLGGVTALFAFAWVVVAFLNGVISPISMLAIPLAITATTLIAVGLKAVRRIDEARERLRTQGLDAGL
ncbi:MAG TPA: hypothetical protein VFZ53_14130 [Polyangiaceae bacterium]